MNDKTTNIEVDLNEEINALDWEITPDRDLWPDVSSQIKFAQRGKRQQIVSKDQFNWSKMAVAACVVLACTAVVLSSLSYYKVHQTHEMQASYIKYQQAQIALMEQQHAHVRAQFVALLDGEMGQLNQSTAGEIKAVLATFDTASDNLKEAILRQPFNTNYPSKLAKTYRQELKLLNKYTEHYKNDNTAI